MNTFSISANSWNQGLWNTTTHEYSGTGQGITTDKITIELGNQSLTFVGNGDNKYIMVQKCVIRDGVKTFENPVNSTGLRLYVRLFDKDDNVLKSFSIGQGGTADVSGVLTASKIMISVDASEITRSIFLDEESCTNGNYVICEPINLVYTCIHWSFASDDFPRCDDATTDIPDFTTPIPKAQWRVNPQYNDGFVYNELLPNISYNPPPPPPAPTIDPVEFYDEYNAEYLSALYQKHRRYKVRVELLGYYENVVGEITRDLSRGASGSITINNEQITRRSCSLSLINVEKKYLPSPDSPIWFNRKFKLWIGIVTGKHTYWWSYGVFFTTKATCDGATLNIQGIDKGGALDGTIKTGMLDAENVIERGTTLTNVIKDTLMWNEFSSPYLRHNTGASSYPVDPIAPIIDTKFDKITTQAEITINANDYISTLFSSIADGYGADAYYNTNGHFVFQTMADDSRIDGYRFMAHQWDFKDTDEMYSNASVEYNMDGFNVVTVYTNESTLENVSYTASNNNPASPLRLDSAGIRRMSDVEIPYINVAQNEMVDRCKAYADYLLIKEAMDRMSLTFSCPIIPHLDVNRTIGVTDKRYNLESATFIINSITMPLSAESMTINATQIAWLPDDTSIEGGAD